MKYALIGCGRVSGNHIKAALENNLEIVALCDVVPEKAEKIKKDFSLNEKTLVYTDYKAMLNDVNVDFVAIATESGTHAEIAIYCAENKVNFIVEKPLAMSIAEADDIINAVEKNNVKACVSHQNRFNIAVQHLHNAILNQRFGKISHGSINIRWHRGEDYYTRDNWRGKWASDGGTLMNQCIHGIDLLSWMLGEEVSEVCGMTNNAFHSYIEAEDIGVAVVRFKNGAVATIEGTTNCFEDFEQTLCVFGENGTVRLGGMNANKVDTW
ncbi:MAG: Gfo/Idh/MocA family oxidoreductase, partial [Clostridia bacterium]|nr:Gfo/Idh/MocA family oxidoreductase [Clostridia bacterium]